MALKAQTNDSLDYLNKLLKENGLEIVLPDDKDKKENKDKKEKTKEDKK